MMAGARGELVQPYRTAGRTRRACDDGRTFVVRLERIDFGTGARRTCLPFGFESVLVGGGIEPGQKFAVALDRLLDEVPRGGCEYGAPFLAVAVEQMRTGPALQGGG